MRHYNDPGWGYVRAGLVGAVVAAVVVTSFPVVAAVGGNLVLGQANTADARTTLSGSTDQNLRVVNTKAGGVALDLRVQSGAPPLKVNSTVRVAGLNADLVDGKHAASFATAAHTHTGVYLPVGGKAADADLLDGRDSAAFTGRGAFCPPGASLVGYSRSGPVCSAAVGSVTVDAAGDVGGYASLVLDASGYPVISYSDQTNTDLKLAHCNDPNCSGGGESLQAVAPTGWGGMSSSLVLDRFGYPVIAYFNWDDGYLMVAHCNDPNCAGGDESIEAVDTLWFVGQHTSLALDRFGYPVISYYDDTNDNLKLAHCNDPNCAGGDESIEAVDTTGEVGQDTSLALDPYGYPVISYYDATNRNLKVAHCNDANCSGGDESIEAVDTTGDVGRRTSLMLDRLGHPVISYHDDTNDDLKVAHCNDPNCAGGNESLQTVDTNGDGGHQMSLTLDASGFPVIAYQGHPDDLKVLHCNDPDCSGGDELLRTVDTTGCVGVFTSLVLDASGHPVIAYYDYSNGNLKLAAWMG